MAMYVSFKVRMEEGDALWEAGKFSDAVQIYEELAKGGFVPAICKLGDCYSCGAWEKRIGRRR